MSTCYPNRVNIFHAIVLGVIEGVTEFLPVSSTFHMIVASNILGLQQTDFQKLFEVFIQAGAILSVFILYFKTFLHDREMLKKILVAFVPTAIIGFALYKVIKGIFFESMPLMLTVFIAIGVFFIVYEQLIKRGKYHLVRSIHTITYQEAIIIGLIQSLAVVPGVSRAGAVILGMMFLKFKRDESAKFSFMLSIPTILAASGYDLLKMHQVLFAERSNLSILIVGLISAFASSYIVVKWFINYLGRHSLTGFGIYRLIAGLLLVFMK